MFYYNVTDGFNLSFYLPTTMIVGTNHLQFAVEHMKYFFTVCDVNSVALLHVICLCGLNKYITLYINASATD